MKEYLAIKNFGPIDDVVIDDIKPFTVFIGESGCGKSTIMKVLALFRWMYKMVNIRSYLKDYSHVRKSPFRFNFPNYLKNDGLDGYLKGNSYLKYSRGACEMEYRDGKFRLISQSIPKSELNLEKNAFISEKRNLIPDVMDHNLNINKKAFYLNEVWNDYSISSNTISELQMPFVNVTFKSVKTKQGEKHYIIPIGGEEYKVELKAASSGIQSSTPIAIISEYFHRHYNLVKSMNLSILSYLSEFDDISQFKSDVSIASFPNKRVNLFIEEPELSLFPDNQVELMDFLMARSLKSANADYDITLTMSTHSPFVVNYLNVLLLKNENGFNGEDIAVYRIYEGKIQDLRLKDDDGRIVAVDTRDLSEAMQSILNAYQELNAEKE